jgi:1-acyl-sn-glycerol-3-phosphate acyltransferase
MIGMWIFTLSRWIVMGVARLWFRIEFEGTEHIPKAGPFLLAPNHVSYLDPFWVSLPVGRPMRYMTWDEMTRKPIIGPLMRAYGAFPVDIRRGDRLALRRAADQLQRGGGLVVFPEGGRTSTGELMSFKPGAILLALEAGVPIIPATILGGYEAYSRHHLLPRPRKVRVRYHPPLLLTLPPGEEVTKEFLRQQAVRLRSIVASGFEGPPIATPSE